MNGRSKWTFKLQQASFYKQNKRGKWREFKFHVKLVVEASSIFFGHPMLEPFSSPFKY
jgi:hypothetical protein